MQIHLDRKQLEQIDGGAIAFLVITLFIVMALVY
jgi:hypothetical protein